MATECSTCPPKGEHSTTRCMNCPNRGRVVGMTEFNENDIRKNRKKNPALSMAMAEYNMRALRGDFDSY